MRVEHGNPLVIDFAIIRCGGYELSRRVAKGIITGDKVIEELDNSGIRGLGGAGFPVGRKWRIVRDQPGEKLMA